MIEGTEEASSRRNSLLAGSMSDSNIETDLFATNPKGEYVLDKAFLRLAKERGLSLH